jgi:hypothetical protein
MQGFDRFEEAVGSLSYDPALVIAVSRCGAAHSNLGWATKRSSWSRAQALFA